MLKWLENLNVCASNQFTYFSISFIIGVFFASLTKSVFSSNRLYLVLLFFIFVLATFINFVLRNRFLILFGLCIFFLMVGFLYCSYFDYKTHIDWSYEKNAIILARVAARPQLEINNQKLLLSVQNMRVADQERRISNKLLLVNASLLARVEYGDLIKIEGKISEPMSSPEFDYQRYLKKYPVYGVINQAEGLDLINRPNHPLDIIFRSLYRLSSKLEDSLNRTLSEPHASLAAGIILGQKRSLPEDFTDDLSRVGLSHVVAISGFNITIIFVVIGGILSAYFRPKQVFWMGAIIALILVLLTGMPPSIVRAAIFSILVLFGKTIGRKASQINLMLLAAVVMLAINPFLLNFDLGFELSFLAFAGLIFISPILKNFLLKYKNNFLQTWVFCPLGETLGAQLAVMPLIMVSFGRLSVISPVSNLLTLWAVELVMAFAFLSAFLGLISIWLAQFSAYLLWPLLQYIVAIVEILSRLPFASIEIGKGTWVVGVMLYLALVLLIKKFYSKKYL